MAFKSFGLCRTSIFSAVCLAFSLCSPLAHASTVSVLASEQGWITQGGTSNGTSDSNNYLVGSCTSCRVASGEFRNFFAFNIPALSGPAVSATFVIDTFTLTLNQSSPLVYTITSTSSLDFAALGTGTVFGSHTYTSGGSFVVDIALDSAALSAIGSGGLTLFVSGRVTSPTSFGLNEPDQFVFGGSQGQQELLITTAGETPLPAALSLFASGMGALGVLSWRRKRKGNVSAELT